VARDVRRDVDLIVGLLGPILATPADGVASAKFRKFMSLISFHPHGAHGACFIRWG